MSEFTLTELIACAEREVRRRRLEYPRLTAKHKMSFAVAVSEIAMMQEIAHRLGKVADADPRAAGRLL